MAKIIVTNDDGIDAPGLEALRSVCAEWGEVVVVAPEGCHSGMGHRMTTAIGVTELAPDRFSLSGTPADCARIAIKHLAPDADWLISGINEGGNLGSDVYVSGTVAAAREAALLGMRSIAISQYVARGRKLDWAVSRQRAKFVLSLLLEAEWREGTFWNVNLPHPAHNDGCEISFCPLDYQPMDVRFVRKGAVYHYEGDYHARPRAEGHDVTECFGGKITATRVGLRLP